VRYVVKDIIDQPIILLRPNRRFTRRKFFLKFTHKTGLPALSASTKVPPCFYQQVAGVAQLVRAPVCGTGGRRFETGHSPHKFVFCETNYGVDCEW
jgi:hypothetical protein